MSVFMSPKSTQIIKGNRQDPDQSSGSIRRNSTVGNEHSNVNVICRFRPLNNSEKWQACSKFYIRESKTVVIGGKDSSNSFTFDRIFDADATQEELYEMTMLRTVDDFFKGYNGTVLTYGQTGSGKSYTMTGPSLIDEENRGIIPRMADDLFKRIKSSSSEIEYTVSASYMEIYNEHINDLLNPKAETGGFDSPSPKKFVISEDKNNGIYVKGLSKAFISSSEELESVIKQGNMARSIGSTSMNASSSRSHVILQINLSQRLSEVVKKSRLFLVDLAGSEKVDKTGAQGQSLEEAKKINSSLSALGNVIFSLTDGKSTHVPYRDSKLTRILQESLGGNSRTSLIITCSPSIFNESETLSTLRFGARAKRIKNNVHINTEMSAGSLQNKLNLMEKENKDYKKRIAELEKELDFWKSGSDLDTRAKEDFDACKNTNNSDSSHRLIEELEQRNRKICELEDEFLNLKMENVRISHQEDHKLAKLEGLLLRLNEKLADVELVNINLRKHLLISEKIIESRDVKIENLKSALKEQKLQVLKESLNFENKLNYIKDRLESYSQKSDNEARELVPESKHIDTPKEKHCLGCTLSSRLNRNVSSNLKTEQTQVELSPPKTGINLNIVKPLRGGNNDL